MECAKAGWRAGCTGGEPGVKRVAVKLIGWLYEWLRGEPWVELSGWRVEKGGSKANWVDCGLMGGRMSR